MNKQQEYKVYLDSISTDVFGKKLSRLSTEEKVTLKLNLLARKRSKDFDSETHKSLVAIIDT